MAVHKCQHFHDCTNHTLSETPTLSTLSKKNSTHQHFLSAKNSHENNKKNQAKKLKVYGISDPCPLQKYMVCTLVKMLTFMDGP